MVGSIENQRHAGFVHAASLPVQQLKTLVDIRFFRLPLRNHEQDMRGVVSK